MNKLIATSILASVILGTLIFLASCDNTSKKPFDKEFNLEGVSIPTTVYMYDSQDELIKVYFKYLGSEITSAYDSIYEWKKENNVRSLEGFALTPVYDVNEGPDLETYFCEIHMMRTEHQNDADSMETLGHEFLHCLYGSWHPEWWHNH